MAKATKTKERTPRVNVLLTPEDFDRLTDYCERTGHKKSTLIATLIRRFLDRKAAKIAASRAKAAPRTSSIRAGTPRAKPPRARR